MYGGHLRAIAKQVYNKNGLNLTGSIEDFTSGKYGLLALQIIQGVVGALWESKIPKMGHLVKPG
jgi:hypothetical protein